MRRITFICSRFTLFVVCLVSGPLLYLFQASGVQYEELPGPHVIDAIQWLCITTLLFPFFVAHEILDVLSVRLYSTLSEYTVIYMLALVLCISADYCVHLLVHVVKRLNCSH